MNILVCIKPVPDPEKYGQIKIDEKSKRIIREGIPAVINPSDKNALEEAIRLREKLGGKITVISMAPEFSKDKLVEALAMGADEAYILSDKVFAGADTYITSKILSESVKKVLPDFDIILAGNESADGATSHVPVQIAEWLGVPHVCRVSKLEISAESNNKFRAWKKTEKGKQAFEGCLPAVIAVSGDINKPRLINAMGIIKAKKKPLTLINCEGLSLDAKQLGINGSPTKPGKLLEPDMSRASADLGSEVEEVASKIIDIIEKAGV